MLLDPDFVPVTPPALVAVAREMLFRSGRRFRCSLCTGRAVRLGHCKINGHLANKLNVPPGKVRVSISAFCQQCVALSPDEFASRLQRAIERQKQPGEELAVLEVDFDAALAETG